MIDGHRIFLCGITSSGNEANLRALIEPISEHLDGLQWTFHTPKDEGAEYLESRKGEGEIVYARYCERHGYSMCHYLWQGTMKPGDYFLQVDTLERVSPQFFYEKLPQFIELMEQTDTAMVANFGKGFIFRYNEALRFEGSPHWYAQNLDGRAINVELEKRYFWNVRAEQRDEFQWVRHYVKYHLFPPGSNSALLGLEQQGDPQILFPQVEARRLAFREEVRKRGFPLTVDGVVEMFRTELDDTLRGFINTTKCLNDLYRYEIQGDLTVVHSHKLTDMKEIK